MTTTKTKRPKATGLTNRIDFEVTVDRCSFIDTELRRLYADRDALVQKAQNYSAAIIAELEKEQKTKLALCEKFASAHRAELLPDEKKSKSAETPLSVFGFRTGTPALKLVAKMTWEKVVAMLQADRRPLWLRTKVEPAKDIMLGCANANIKNVQVLAKYGVRVVQTESFFIEPKVDGAETIKKESAA